jgi:dethiobiotin synthetase
MEKHALLIAGTDTEVGKTVVGLLLAAALSNRGLAVAAMKPVESGCEPDALDAQMLAAVAGGALERVCPYRLELPVAPQAAAEAEGRSIELDVIRQGLDGWREEADIVLVEAAGGLGTPYAPGLLVLDLARELELPVLLVARHALGTVGQTLVALRLMRHEGVHCAGVVLSQTTREGPGPEARTHAPLLAQHGGDVPLLGILPHLPPPPASPPDGVHGWAEWHHPVFEEAVDLDRLLGRLA